MAAGLAALATAVDDAVAVPVADLCAADLQTSIGTVARRRDRLDGWLSAAAGQLSAATGGRVATDDDGDRSGAGWLAEATCTSSGAAGSWLRTSAALRDLPLVVQAVLDEVLSQENAAILARLVGKVALDSLRESQPNLIQVVTGRDPVQLATRRGADGSVEGSFSLASATPSRWSR